MSEHDIIPIWFFIGLLLFVYGLLIVGAGIYALYRPPQVALAHWHADLWWGGLVLLAGAYWLFRFNPGRKKS